MTHWGWYWKKKLQHTPKSLCSSFPCLDSFKLCKENIEGFSIDSRGINADRLPGYFKVNIENGRQQGNSYLIPVEKQSCHFGGFRYFFRCPACRKRMRKLYGLDIYFFCRKCHNLGYHSQRQSSFLRFGNMSYKIEKVLKEKGGSIHLKPKWMRSHTFERLKKKYWNYEMKAEIVLHNAILGTNLKLEK